MDGLLVRKIDTKAIYICYCEPGLHTLVIFTDISEVDLESLLPSQDLISIFTLSKSCTRSNPPTKDKVVPSAEFSSIEAM